jgi:hypothetical protein
MWTCHVAHQSNRPILLHSDSNACHILTSVPSPPRLPIRSGSSTCALVTVAPSVTPTHAGALTPGHAPPRSPAAVTASRHLAKIFVAVGPLGPYHHPRTTRLMPLMAACRTPCGDGAGPGLHLERDMLMCCRVAFCVLAWARPDRQRLRSRHTPTAAQLPRLLLGSPRPGAPQKSCVTSDLVTPC